MSIAVLVGATGLTAQAAPLAPPIALASQISPSSRIVVSPETALSPEFAFLPETASSSGPRQRFGDSQASIIPVVVFGKDSRRSPDDFATEHHLDAAEMVRNHSASGLIQCGDAHGAGQLTLSTNVVTTAAHVFFDENGIPRAHTCTFDMTVDGKTTHVPIDLGSIVAGSTNPYAVAPAHDWAVARLTHRVAGVKPYGIAEDIHTNEPISFVARGHIDWGDAKNLSVEQCLLHDQLSSGAEGTREFSFDCDTGDGASGGAVMFDKDRMMVGAILVGWRSNRPFSAVPFSRTHYNFAVTLEGDFRKAVLAAAGNLTAQK